MPFPPGGGSADLGSSVDAFLAAAERFFENLAAVDWGYLALALALWGAMLVARAHGWANAIRAAYPDRPVDELGIVASFLAGAGINGVLPARIGDAVKVVLARRAVPGSSFAAILSSFAVLTPFDVALGLCVLAYALTLGLLPDPPELPDLPAFEISFWAEDPERLLFFLTALGILALAAFALAARHVEALWDRLKQGVAIFREPRRYLREVAAWQGVGWVCRFLSFWLFLEAFGIGGSAENVLLVMSVQAISSTLPFTPGGLGAQQALLIATLSGPSRAAVLSYSVGQQIAVAAWAAVLGFASLVLVFRTRDWRGLIRQAEAEREAAEERGAA